MVHQTAGQRGSPRRRSVYYRSGLIERAFRLSLLELQQVVLIAIIVVDDFTKEGEQHVEPVRQVATCLIDGTIGIDFFGTVLK